MQVVVASTNQVKIDAVGLGFERMFRDQAWEATGVAVPSGVGDQPMTDADTLQGALNRSLAAQLARPTADYWVGIEGGCEDTARGLEAFAWVVVRGPGGRLGQARSGTFLLPPAVADLVRQGVELGEADDRVFGRQNSKQANGAIGLLTGDVIDRVALYEHAVILALVPFLRPDLY
jgi:inosine/xanthosine triphosphatase